LETVVLITIDPVEPEPWLIGRVTAALRRGGLVVLPTDTVYALACPLSDEQAIERLYDLKRLPPTRRLSILVPDIAAASRYARGIPNPVHRAMRRVLPGPYTFIFRSSNEVPRIMLHKRRTVGLRIPDSPIALAVLEDLAEPLLSTSVRNDADEWLLDPAAIAEELRSRVDLVVDGGRLAAEPSTVVDLTGDRPVLVRKGKGDVAALELFD
jgi:tRNA threonylcarbamoyl adenosine modification protein (Sua5/YciO/YrdC/YwlC family)